LVGGLIAGFLSDERVLCIPPRLLGAGTAIPFPTAGLRSSCASGRCPGSLRPERPPPFPQPAFLLFVSFYARRFNLIFFEEFFINGVFFFRVFLVFAP